MSTLPPIPYTLIVDTIGAIVLGNILSAALWGVTCAQAWHYYQHFPNDSRFIKWLVFGLLLSDTAHQALITHVVWNYAVANYVNPLALENAIWSFTLQVFPQAVTAFCVENFFIYRIYILSEKKWWLVTPLFTTNLAAAGLALVYTFRVTPIKTFAGVSAVFRHVLGAAGIVAFISDLTIALVLCYFLYTRRTGRRSMTVVLNRLIFYALGTGLATSIFTFAAGVVFLVAPDTFIWGSIYFVASKLHVNSLLLSLNARRMMQEHFNGDATTFGISGSSLPSSGIHVEQQSTRRADRTVNGPLTFKAARTTFTTTAATGEDIEMDKSAGSL